MTPTVNGATAPTSSDSGDKANNVSKRVNKLLDVRIENDKDALTALKDLHGFFSVNSLHSRRSLRSQIEKRSIVINQDFLEEFRKVKERLDLIYQNVNDMNDAVNSMSSQLSATKAQTHQLIEQTSKLQAENNKLAMKEQVAKAFLKTFQLSETEVQILRAGEVSVEFFDVLERVAKIHKDSNTLVTSGGQTLALEIMEQMSIYQETALEKLYRWAQVHCKNIDSPTSNKLFSLAMAKLQDRPTLFKISVPPAGLTPSSGIESLLALLRALLSAPPPPSYVDKIVNAIIEPLIQAINVSASRLSTAEMAVYLLNCLHLILNTVTLFEFMDEWLERLQAQCDAQIDTLTSEQASSLVANLNLSPMYTILQENPRREAAIQPTALNTFVVIIAIYKQLHEYVHDPKCGYSNPQALLPRDPSQIVAILGGGSSSGVVRD
ncbi:unnamed protein product [Nesidiocoris tenuis]|uniref:Conserved oligomeric Golgi complex subunit 6 n=1 Tax=Nesidiocoris tenuis TaxID=355587 RepID=A0A6H5H085_9HEMI|nr:unnamed protein product [Nesidiocoris tenuis]